MAESDLKPFHLAIPVTDIDAAHRFYVDVLGCGTGRTASRWLDLDFFGHQVTLHLVDEGDPGMATNPVDSDDVPARHFGIVLDRPDWDALSRKLQQSGVEFLIEPKIRFASEVGEQATMFLRDPSGNAIEFKSLRDPDRLFAV